MKKPTLKGWLAIAGAVIAAILTIIVALKDGNLTTDEAGDITAKLGEAVNTIQVETAE